MSNFCGVFFSSFLNGHLHQLCWLLLVRDEDDDDLDDDDYVSSSNFQTSAKAAGVSAEHRRQLQDCSGRDHRPAGGARAGHGWGKLIRGWKQWQGRVYDVKSTLHAAVWGGGQRKPVSVSEESGHRRQQASSQERQAEAALHFQRGSALYRGVFEGSAHLGLNIWSFWHINTSSELHVVPSVLLQNEEFTEETIKFGVESVYIDSWVRRRIYDAFKEIMESGVRHHLQVRHVLWNNGSVEF